MGIGQKLTGDIIPQFAHYEMMTAHTRLDMLWLLVLRLYKPGPE